VLAIFPRNPATDVQALASALNEVDWEDIGFICDGRFLFTQRSLEQTLLPGTFRSFLPKNGKSLWKKLRAVFLPPQND
jgi:adenine-specific DNA-methyltransferase